MNESEMRVRVLKSAAIVVAALGIAGWWLTRAPNAAHDIARLPVEERRALFERTMTTLRTDCAGDPGPGMTRYCRQQAEFVATFPECDHGCREVVARFVGPTR